MNYWSAFEASRFSADYLEQQGMTLRTVVDFDEIPEVVGLSGKSYLTPILDPRQNDFSAENSFWLIAEKDGVPVIVGGARVDDVGGNGGAFVKRLFNRTYGEGTITAVDARVGDQIRGRAAYFGDLFSSAAGRLGRRNVRYFLAVANYIAVTHYQVDCVYSFMRGADVQRGSADVNGFMGRNLAPLEWGVKPQGRGDAEQLVYRQSDDHVDYFEAVKLELACRRSEPSARRLCPQP